MAGNPGGDQYDGTVTVIRCPWCDALMQGVDDLEEHYKRHEARGEQKKYTND